MTQFSCLFCKVVKNELYSSAFFQIPLKMKKIFVNQGSSKAKMMTSVTIVSFVFLISI